MRRLLTIVAAGAVGVVIGPAVAPAIGRVLRPVARSAIKAGFVAMRRGREQAAVLAETLDDLKAEAIAEFEQE